MMHRRSLLAVVSLIGMLVVSGCARRSPATTPDRSDAAATAFQTGLASWYGKKFHGRQTASGERYDMHDLTAAHRTLPFGSRVRVVSQASGRAVVVRINDRGPFVGGRIIDLSYAAARRLEMIEAGVVPVALYRAD
jgi:rare lipoprotein A